MNLPPVPRAGPPLAARRSALLLALAAAASCARRQEPPPQALPLAPLSWTHLTQLPLDVAELEVVPTSPPPPPGDLGALL